MELKDFLQRRNIHVALIQETKLRPTSKTPSFPGFTALRVDRPGDGGGGGLLALVSRALPFTHTTAASLASLPVDGVRELLSLTLRVDNSDLRLTNVYIPPSSSCPPGYSPDLSALSSFPQHLLLGDFNAHDST